MSELAPTAPLGRADAAPKTRAPARAPRFPRLPLFLALGLIAFSIAAAAFGRYTDIGTIRMPQSEPLDIRDVSFDWRTSDDVVVVTDARTGETLARLPPNTDGFIRGSLRGLGRARAQRDVAATEPYRLILWRDGRLTLTDTRVPQRVDLNAFGATNAAAFRRFLESERANNRDSNQEQGGRRP